MAKRLLSKITFWNVMTTIVLAVFCLFVIYPLFSVFLNSFKENGTDAFTFANYANFFGKKYYLGVLRNSIVVTVLVTVLAVVFGGLLAYVMSVVRIRGKGILEMLIIISMLSPPFIGAYSWVQLLGRQGFITNLLRGIGIEIGSIYGFKGILLVFTIKLFPYIYMYLSGALKKMDASLLEAAESLGCHGIKKLFTIVLPLVLPTVAAGALVVFTNAFADFGTPMLIGEGFQTLPTLVYSEFVGEVGGNARFSAALCVIMIVLAGLAFIGQKYIVNRKSYVMSSLKPLTPQKARGLKNVLAHAFTYFMVLLAFLPQLTVLVTAFRNSNGLLFTEGFGFGNFQLAFKRAGRAIVNTYTYSFVAIAIIIVVGMIVAYVTVRKRSGVTNVLDSVVMFPFIVPGAVLGISLLSAFNTSPLLLSGTAAIIIISYVVRRLPYTVRSGAAILYQLSPSMEEASISLGYSPAQTFRNITAKLMMSGIASGAILSWITCINELSSSLMLYVGKTKTMSITIYLEALKGYQSVAAALAAILTFSTVIALLIVFRLSGKGRDITI